jgi:hypothetical protein
MGTNTGGGMEGATLPPEEEGEEAEGCVVSGPRGSRPPFILVRNKKTKILWSSSTEGAGEKKKKRVRGGGGLPLPQVSWSVRSSSSGFGSLPAEQFWWTSSRTIRPRCSSSLWQPTDLETVGYPLMDHEEACNKKDGWPYLREIQGLPEDQVSRPTGNHHAPPVSIITGALPVLFTYNTVQYSRRRRRKSILIQRLVKVPDQLVDWLLHL